MRLRPQAAGATLSLANQAHPNGVMARKSLIIFISKYLTDFCIGLKLPGIYWTFLTKKSLERLTFILNEYLEMNTPGGFEQSHVIRSIFILSTRQSATSKSYRDGSHDAKPRRSGQCSHGIKRN